MKKTALLIVDIQNDYFEGGNFEQEGAEAAAQEAAKAVEFFRKHELPVFHIRHESTRPDSGFFLPGTKGAEIHPQVAPIKGETVIKKHFPNSFRETELQEKLASANVEKLIVVGMMTLMCIDATVRAAFDLGYDVTVLHDACSARALEFNGVEVSATKVHAAFLAALGMVYAEIKDVDTCLSEFEG